MFIFTDGSALHPGGPGGIAAVITGPEYSQDIAVCFPLAATTSARAELMAAFMSLHLCSEDQEVTVFSDCVYVTAGINEWLSGWKSRGFRNSKGREIANRDLWEAIDRLLPQRKVVFRRVRGHQGNPGNEIADYAAKAAAKSIQMEDTDNG